MRQCSSGLTMHCAVNTLGSGTTKIKGKREKRAVSTELRNDPHGKTEHGFCWGNISGTRNFTVWRHFLASTFSGFDRRRPFPVMGRQVESVRHLSHCTQDL